MAASTAVEAGLAFKKAREEEELKTAARTVRSGQER